MKASSRSSTSFIFWVVQVEARQFSASLCTANYCRLVRWLFPSVCPLPHPLWSVALYLFCETAVKFVGLSFCLSVCVLVWLPGCPSICFVWLPAFMSLYFSVYMSLCQIAVPFPIIFAFLWVSNLCLIDYWSLCFCANLSDLCVSHFVFLIFFIWCAAAWLTTFWQHTVTLHCPGNAAGHSFTKIMMKY